MCLGIGAIDGRTSSWLDRRIDARDGRVPAVLLAVIGAAEGWMATREVLARSGMAVAIAHPLVGLAMVLLAAWLAEVVWRVAPGVRVLVAVARRGPLVLPARTVYVRRGGREIRTRIYAVGRPARVLVLAPGLGHRNPRHAAVRAAIGALQRLGFAVVAPELEDLWRWRIRADALCDLEAVLEWTIERSGLVAPGEQVVVAGLDAGASLALVAAGRSRLDTHIARVIAVAPVGRLDRVVRHHLDGGGHPLVLALVLSAIAPRVVPPGQVHPLRAALDAWMSRRPAAADLLHDLPEPSRGLVLAIREGRTEGVRAMLAQRWVPSPDDVLLSPQRQVGPRCPVFLLHGARDPVVPVAESRALARSLGAGTRVVSLITSAIDPSRLRPASVVPTARLLWWMGRALRR